MKDEYPQRELSAAIIGAAMKVLNGLRPGLDEKIYENSLVLELIAQGHQVEQQRRFPVHYRGHLVGTLIPDILVDEKVIVDPKVVEAFADDHIAQMLGYLAISELELVPRLRDFSILNLPSLAGNESSAAVRPMNPEVTRRIALISAREVVASKYLRSSASCAVPSQNARAKKSSQVATILAYSSADHLSTSIVS